MKCALRSERYHLRGRKRERLVLVTAQTCEWECTEIRVQYKGYNLIGVTTVEGGATRDMTALVYSGILMRLHRGMYRCTD